MRVCVVCVLLCALEGVCVDAAVNFAEPSQQAKSHLSTAADAKRTMSTRVAAISV